jgi:uncharacterized protein with HEPN domain
MKKPPEIFFKHMLLAIGQIEEYIKGLDAKSFHSDSKTCDAVIRQMEIIGEAAGRIDDEIVKDSPIPWAHITGIRHRLIHDYFGVDVDIVWKTASAGLKPLKKYLQKKVCK